MNSGEQNVGSGKKLPRSFLHTQVPVQLHAVTVPMHVGHTYGSLFWHPSLSYLFVVVVVCVLLLNAIGRLDSTRRTRRIRTLLWLFSNLWVPYSQHL